MNTLMQESGNPNPEEPRPEPKTFVKTSIVLERKLLKELLIKADSLDLTLNELIKSILENEVSK